MPLGRSELDGAGERYAELEEGRGDGNDYNEDVSISCCSTVKPSGRGPALFAPVNLHCGCQ